MLLFRQEEFSKKVLDGRSHLRGKLDCLHNEANPVHVRSNEGYRLPTKLKIGDDVLIYDIDKKAVVLELVTIIHGKGAG